MQFPGSDHFNGKTFFYPGGPPRKGWLDLLRWKWTSRAARWPARVPVDPKPAPPAPPSGISATWIGHSTFLLRTPVGAVLTDPVFSERVGPVSWAGPRRVIAPGIAFETLPRIDLVLLSHDHFDHLDLPSLRRIVGAWAPAIAAPLGTARLLRAIGARTVLEMDWWQETPLPFGGTVTFVPARHWSRRSIAGTNRTLWGGFTVATAGRSLYFAGDTGFDAALFQAIRERTASPDLALLPIGAYAPRWFMADAHMDPAEAVRAHRLLGARQSVAMHWGTFPLTDEARDEPPLHLRTALADAKVPLSQFRVLEPGETLGIGP